MRQDRVREVSDTAFGHYCGGGGGALLDSALLLCIAISASRPGSESPIAIDYPPNHAINRTLSVPIVSIFDPRDQI